jgi:hypothetical protein
MNVDHRTRKGMSMTDDFEQDRERTPAEHERMRGALKRILAVHVGFVGDTRSYCLICAPGDGRWPCVTVMEAREALGVGEAKS